MQNVCSALLTDSVEFPHDRGRKVVSTPSAESAVHSRLYPKAFIPSVSLFHVPFPTGSQTGALRNHSAEPALWPLPRPELLELHSGTCDPLFEGATDPEVQEETFQPIRGSCSERREDPGFTVSVRSRTVWRCRSLRKGGSGAPRPGPPALCAPHTEPPPEKHSHGAGEGRDPSRGSPRPRGVDQASESLHRR